MQQLQQLRFRGVLSSQILKKEIAQCDPIVVVFPSLGFQGFGVFAVGRQWRSSPLFVSIETVQEKQRRFEFHYVCVCVGVFVV